MTPASERTDVPARPGKLDWLLYALLPTLIAIIMSMKALPEVFAGGLVNPDSYMRLVRLEQGPWNHALGYVVQRDGSGAGTLVHWSHLLDTLLLLVAAPFHLFVDMHGALHAAAVAFGPLCMAGLGLALAWAAAPFAERRWLWLAPVAAALSASILPYGLAGEAHHHVLLVIVAVMTSGYAVRAALGMARRGNGLAIGAWAGLGIWLSPESMPFTLMAFGAVWLAWLLSRQYALSRMMGETAAGFVTVVGAAFAVDPPYAGYGSVEIDRISIVYVGLAAAIAAMACATPVIDRIRAPRLTVGVAVPVLCIALWLVCFPKVMLGPDGLMSAHDTHAMMDGIIEMQPVHGIDDAIKFLLGGSIATLALAWLSLSSRSVLLGYATLCGAVLVGLGAMHIRFSAYAAALAAAMLPILITRFSARFADWSESSQAMARVAAMAAFVLLPCGIALAPAQADTHAPGPSCSLASGVSLLADHAGRIVLANPNIAPELLYRTRVLTVGSLYHRNVSAFLRLRAAWRSSPSDTPPAAIRATRASLVLFCPSPTRSLLVADAPPDTLLDRLNQGHVPPWLHRLSEDPQSGTVLYEVMP
jgi:hypothetical protein